MNTIGRLALEREVDQDRLVVNAIYLDKGTSRKYIVSRKINTSNPSNLENNAFHERQVEQILKIRQKYSDPRVKRDEQIYGLLDEKYLINLSDPYKPIGAWSVLDIIEKCRPDDLNLFGIWESIALQMMSEAHEVDRKKMDGQAWLNRWEKLSGGVVLSQAISEYLNNGDLSRTEKIRIIDRISIKRYPEPELAENLLLRIIGAFTRKKLSPDGAVATLLCSHFQRNVTLHDMQQIEQAINALKSSFIVDEIEIKSLQLVLSLSRHEPMLVHQSPEKFTIGQTNNIPYFNFFLRSID